MVKKKRKINVYQKIFSYPLKWTLLSLAINLLFLCVVDIVKVALNMFSYRDVGDKYNKALRLV